MLIRWANKEVVGANGKMVRMGRLFLGESEVANWRRKASKAGLRGGYKRENTAVSERPFSFWWKAGRGREGGRKSVVCRLSSLGKKSIC